MTVMLLCPVLAIDPRSRETLVIDTRDQLGEAATILAADPATANDSLLLQALLQATTHEPLDAVAGLRAWIEAESSAARVKIMEGAKMAIGLILPLPAAVAFTWHDKMTFLGTAVEDARLPSDLCVVFGTAYAISLCAAGDIGRACRLAQRLARRHNHALVRSAEEAITRLALGKAVPNHLSFYVGGDVAPLRDRFCRRPFNFLEITPGGNAYLCCPNYLPLPIGNAANHSVDALLNSPRARAIRRSILDGSFKYCDPSRCEVMHKDQLLARTPEAIEGYGEIAERVSHLQLSYDPTCNLSCPQCRTKPIAAKGAPKQVVDNITDRCVIPMLGRIDTVKLNGFGDIFASKASRRVLSAIDPHRYPRLRVDLFSNGILFTPRQWAAFPGIHGRVRSVRISIDAARPETYAVIRRGGNFDTLMENMEFISGLRRQGMIELLQMAFVYQESNFSEMEEFVALGRRFGADQVVFEPLMDWGTYGSSEDFRCRTIHALHHPRRAEFMAVVGRLRAQAPFVHLSIDDVE